MNKTVKIIIIISAVFFAFASSGFTPIITIEPVEEARPAVKFTPKMHSLQAPVAEQAPAVMQAAVRQIPAIETQAPASVNFDSGYFNPLAIPELKAPVPRPPEPVMTSLQTRPCRFSTIRRFCRKRLTRVCITVTPASTKITLFPPQKRGPPSAA